MSIEVWWAWQDSNLQLIGYEPNALSLNYKPVKMVGARGFEPPISWPQIRRLTKLAYTPILICWWFTTRWTYITVSIVHKVTLWTCDQTTVRFRELYNSVTQFTLRVIFSMFATYTHYLSLMEEGCVIETHPIFTELTHFQWGLEPCLVNLP